MWFLKEERNEHPFELSALFTAKANIYYTETRSLHVGLTFRTAKI